MMTLQSFHQAMAEVGRAKTLAIALALAGAATVTLAQANAARAAPHDQRSRVGDICGSTVGLEPGQAQYEGCVDSLSDSLRSLTQGRAAWAAHDACLDKGLKLGSPDLAVCTLQSTEAKALGATDLTLANAGAARGSIKSYFSTSNRDQFRREQLACAQLGLDPVSGAFDSCVASLRSALFAADNPSQ
jgi:hypothetical protein